jgi:thiol:disulfide interchange protein
MSRLLSAAVVLLALCGRASAQFDKVTFDDLGAVSLKVEPAKAKRGETVTVKLTLTPTAAGRTYPFNPKDPNQLSRNKLRGSKDADLIFVDAGPDPAGAKMKPRDGEPGEDEYYAAAVSWELKAVVSPKAAPGKKSGPLRGLTVMFCGSAGGPDVCLTKSDAAADFEVLPDDAVPVESKYAAAVEKLVPPSLPSPPPPSAVAAGPTETPAPPAAHGGAKKAPVPLADYKKSLDTIRENLEKPTSPDGADAKKTGLGAFLLTAAFWGFISLVTPCVFPMIPITVSIFLKQSHQSTRETLKLASVYCLTIIVVLGVSAIALLKLFVDLSNSPTMNLFLGLLFVFFALSLFGMYDITLPQGMLKFTQGKQGKGGVIGTIFGALAFTIVSFTCVAPFLGGFSGMAASGNFSTFQLVLGGLVFATAFASPFFLLAIFPSLLKKLPRSGGWLDSVKVVMGFLELAAALKFFRTAELRWFSPPEYFTYDVVIAGWVAICFACGLYLLNAYRLPHDEEKPNIGVPRLVIAVTFLGLGVYLAPALMKGPDGKQIRPNGVVFAWVDAFLLPDPTGADEYGTDLAAALDKSRKEAEKSGKPAKPVFVDFTGTICTNCRYNENNVFPKPRVRESMSKFELVQLYADEVPAERYTTPPDDDARNDEGQANRAFQQSAFGTVQLPLYVALQPRPGGKVRVLGVYAEGKINDVPAFERFLTKALDDAKK